MQQIFKRLNRFKTFDNAVKFLGANGFKMIGSGCMRTVYAKDNIVIKMYQYGNPIIDKYKANESEYKVYNKLKNDVLSNAIVPILHFKKLKMFSYVVMPKGKKFVCGNKNDKFRIQFDLLIDLFHDSKPDNMVILNDKLCMCDYSFGLMNNPKHFKLFHTYKKQYKDWLLTTHKT